MSTDNVKTPVEKFIEAIKAKFVAEGRDHYDFSIAKGRKFDKIVAQEKNGSSHVYAFTDKDGNLYKAASWKAPAKGIRFEASVLLTSAVDAADPFGGFLYNN